MDPHSCYVSNLEGHIRSLHLILKEWAAYVPQDIVLKSQVSLGINPQAFQLEPSQSLNSQHEKPLLASPPEPEESWRKQVNSFVKKIPTAENWSKAISPTSPNTESRSSLFILNLLLKEHSPVGRGHTAIPVIHHQQSNILHTLEYYASFTKRCGEEAKLARLIASYQRFLFGVLCHVACCVGIDEKVVNKTMGLISSGSAEHLRQIRLAAAWGVAAIDRLQCKSKWGIRSGDILFYFTPSFSSLRNMAKGKRSKDVFTSSLDQPRYTEMGAGLPKLHTNNLSVPCIIKCIFGKTVRLSDICKFLHADFATARCIFTKWYMKPFGSAVFDDLERSSLFSPMIPQSPRIQLEVPEGGRNPVEDVRKRRRTENGIGSPVNETTLSDLDGQSITNTPGTTISTDAPTTADEGGTSPQPNPQNVPYVDTTFGYISQQQTQEHQDLSGDANLTLMDERQVGWPLPRAHHSNHVSPSARSPDTTLPSGLSPFYQQGSCSDNRRQSPLLERNSIAITPAPRERGDPLAIAELINQDSEPRPLAQSLAARVSRDGHVPSDVENLNTMLEPYAQFNPGHAPPAFNQFDYGTIPTTTQNENLEADLCANFEPSHIPPFNQFDYATIPTVNQNENLDVGVCTSLNLSDIPPTFNQFDYVTIPAIDQNENMRMGLCTNFDTGNPSYGNIAWDTQTEGQDVNHPDAVLSGF